MLLIADQPPCFISYILKSCSICYNSRMSNQILKAETELPAFCYVSVKAGIVSNIRKKKIILKSIFSFKTSKVKIKGA